MARKLASGLRGGCVTRLALRHRQRRRQPWEARHALPLEAATGIAREGRCPMPRRLPDIAADRRSRVPAGSKPVFPEALHSFRVMLQTFDHRAIDDRLKAP